MNGNEIKNPSPDAGGSGSRTSSRRYLRWLLPLVIVLGAAVIAMVLVATRPHARRARPAATARLVEVREVEFVARPVVVEANGTVGAAREVVLHPRVGGEVVGISERFLPGGVMAAGDTVLSIDPADYELALQQRESALAQARAAYDIELGQQDVAREEFEMLGESIAPEDRALVLRAPQLEQAAANLESARAAVEQARLNLERTRVAAPFNALVRTRDVVEGTQVGTNTQLGTLVGSDEYWIEVVVPVDRLQWIDIPAGNGGQGSPVRIYDDAAWGDGVWREGRVLELAADVESQGRLARLIVSVPDPLALDSGGEAAPRLLIGSYVRVEIVGSELPAAAALDREMLRDGDNVWVMNSAGKLEIRPVEVAYRGRETVLVTGGVAAGEKLIETDLAAAVAGMALRAEGEEPDRMADSPATAGGATEAAADGKGRVRP